MRSNEFKPRRTETEFSISPEEDPRLQLAQSRIVDAEKKVASQIRLLEKFAKGAVPAQEEQTELARLNLLLLQARNHHDIVSTLLNSSESRRRT